MHVRKETLLLTAGLVWLAAGVNVARMGIVQYRPYLTGINLLLSAAVFLLFGGMFWAMSKKHVRRILGFGDALVSIFRFFDIKAYCLMALMMTGGIWLRSSGLAPLWFIAFFYTGLGLALALAGVIFIVQYIRQRGNRTYRT